MADSSDQHYLEAEFYALLASDSQTMEFIENKCLDGVWYWDLDNPEHEWMDARFWKTLGYDPEDKPHLASAWMDIIDPDDLEEAKRNVAAHLENPDHAYDQVVRYRHAEGRTVWIRCRGVAIRHGPGAPRRMLGVHTDVSAIVEADRSLEDKRDRLRELEGLNQAILDSTDTGVMTFVAVRDDAGCIVDFTWRLANPAALTITGKSEAELIGHRLLDIFPGNKEAGLFDAYARVVDTGEPFMTELHYPMDGLDEWFRIRAVRSHENMFTVSFSPVTELKQQQAQLETLNASLHNFAFAAAHDLQAPLRQTKMLTSILQEELSDTGVALSPDAAQALTGIGEAVEHMRRLVRSLHTLATLETAQFDAKPVRLNEIVARAADQTAPDCAEAGAIIDIAALPEIRGDASLLTTLFVNLIKNAARYAGAPQTEIRIFACQSGCGRGVNIMVQDNGVGIPSAARQMIFEPFQRITAKGAGENVGLGLSICRRIAKLHGGDLDLDETYSDGARFRLFLPAELGNGV